MKKIPFLFLLILIISCGDNSINKGVIDVKITPETKVVELADLFENWEVLGFDGVDPSLSAYRFISKKEDWIYFLSTDRRKVFRIDKSGMRKIVLDFYGEGPGEYQEIWDIKDIPLTEDFLVLDRKSRKLIRYAANGSLKDEFVIDKKFVSSLLSFEMIDENQAVFQTSGSDEFKFLVLNLKEQSWDFRIPANPDFKDFGFGNDKSMSFSSNRISLIYPLSNQIERYNQSLENLDTVFLDFGSYNISNQDIEVVDNDQSKMFELIQNDEQKRAHSFLLDETENYYVLSYYLGSFMKGDFIKTIIQKEKGTSISYRDVAMAGVVINARIVGSMKDDFLLMMLDSEYLERLEKADLTKVSSALGVELSVARDVLISGKIRSDFN
ncbi:6-bladed beta-propeller [Algoriphagus aquimarinus]|uniref:6-bladed beta-propeller n=1 Tax=Algoriphagus aquimarinus TaxID=237018 RepID=UPI0030DD8ACD|tara:strand:+ start:54160 stop:55305 length:1146 start_codon:yes stop_codon:yes gene_type:complete